MDGPTDTINYRAAIWPKGDSQPAGIDFRGRRREEEEAERLEEDTLKVQGQRNAWGIAALRGGTYTYM
ncbi:hypothetical protein EYF80_051946 [Liparis tanakae]|uniref:Uncharacterized protein n=1 Tax=Liparis tanakae TaxID=230148 RepID=A0A4Z2FAP8_9TELE|nr:hypothetical protein EYF80_051946 [Liparis tanakae]